MTKSKIKVLYISHSDGLSGAGIGAFRSFQAVRDYANDIDIDMLVYKKVSSHPNVYELRPLWFYYIYNSIKYALKKLGSFTRFHVTPNPCLHSTARVSSINVDWINKSDYDVINLHWLGDYMLSIEDIGKIKKPIVWKLADQWAFCGAEHYTSEPSLEGIVPRYILGYDQSPKLDGEYGVDINRRVWMRKAACWTNQMHMICPSNWLKKSVNESKLMGSWPAFHIPNSIDLNHWKPICNSCTSSFTAQVPSDSRIVLYGGVNCFEDYRKGGDYFEKILDRWINLDPQKVYTFITFGNKSGKKLRKLKQNIYRLDLGYIPNDQLPNLYSSADFFLFLSRFDNMPNTAVEAHACGLPIISFKSGGIIDIIQDNVTGFLVDDFCVKKLTLKLFNFFEHDDLDRLRTMKIKARERAVDLWSPETMAKSYSSIYKKAFNQAII